ncbi:MAG: ribonuclease T [Xanthomonadales bacterium]|nr:ribonuclease T [Xanthomonadales bacterium]
MPRIADRFRGFLPVVVDLETGGFDPKTNALLEVAACIVRMDDFGRLKVAETVDVKVAPFAGAKLDPASLEFNGIDMDQHLETALPEKEALQQLCRPIRQEVRDTGCQRAIMVAHNPAFDLAFWNAAVERTGFKRSPFHPFSSFDTATLGGLAFGQTVLSRAVEAAGLEFSEDEAHSAAYDAQKTAELFCTIVNRWKIATGFPDD